MKKTILFAIIALAAVSCEIHNDYAQDNQRTGRNLLNYTRNLLGKFVLGPVDDLAFMLKLDEYILLTPEEQNTEEWESMKNAVEHFDDTHLKIKAKGLEINTNGVSIRTPGSWWTMTIANAYIYSSDDGYNYHLREQYATAPGHGTVKRITCTAENRYEITDETGGKDMMLLSADAITGTIENPDGTVVDIWDFSCSCRGRIAENEKGLGSEFNAEELMYRINLKDWSNETRVLDWRVVTYHNGQPLDWCFITREPEKAFQYGSNLKIEPNRLPRE